ncbi:MAG TPA: Gfo/Idh/MocA family oxidoreductase [Vicinamibacterales bacterium]
MTNGLRVAVVGCGAIAEIYHLPALATHRDIIERAVLVDPDVARARGLAAKFGAARVTPDVERIADEIDAAIVATPPGLHARVAIPLLARGVHVLCEKPLAGTADDAAAMIDQAARSGARLCVNQTRRAFPAFRRVKELLDSGAIGECVSIEHSEGVRFDWQSASGWHFSPGSPASRGVLFDQGAHVFDTICWWLRGRPTVVSCATDSFGGPEGVASIVLQHRACKITIRLSWLSRLSNTYRVVGTRGDIKGGATDWRQLTVAGENGRPQRFNVSSDPGDYLAFGSVVLDNFLDVIRGEAAPLAPAASVLPSLELLDECYRRATRIPMPWVDPQHHALARGKHAAEAPAELPTSA